jgi:hypothetical protein
MAAPARSMWRWLCTWILVRTVNYQAHWSGSAMLHLPPSTSIDFLRALEMVCFPIPSQLFM